MKYILLFVSCLTPVAARTAAGGQCAVLHRITLSASAPQQLLLLRGGTTSSNSEEGAKIAADPNASAAVANGTVSSATIAIAPSATPILRKALRKAIGGGVGGLLAGVVQVLTLMWLRLALALAAA